MMLGDRPYKPAVFFLLFVATMLITRSVEASNNHLGFSLAAEQEDSNNYLFSEQRPESLSGEHLIPKLIYSYETDVNLISLDMHRTLERYNRPGFDSSSPTYALNLAHTFERAKWTFNYSQNQQSTRLSEFSDSGNSQNGTSFKHENDTTSSYQYRLDERDVLSLNGFYRANNYDNKNFSDLVSYGLQPTWQYEFSQKLTAYLGLSYSGNNAYYRGFFPIAPLFVRDHRICPPNSFLINDVCISRNPDIGTAKNVAQTTGLVSGVNYEFSDSIKVSASFGDAKTRTVQHLNSPQITVEFGPPIDESLVFGGLRDVESSANSNSADLGVSFAGETSVTKITYSKEIQPSSTGSLWDTDSLQLFVKNSFSERSSANFTLSYTEFKKLDDKILISAIEDRNILQAAIQYNHEFTNTWLATFSVEYNRQSSDSIHADAIHSNLSIVYKPREWTW